VYRVHDHNRLRKPLLLLPIFTLAFGAGVRHLTSLVNTKGDNVRVQHGQVEWCQEHVNVGKSDEASTIDNRSTILVDGAVGLEGVTLVGSSNGEWSVRQVELVGPSDEGWGTSNTASGRNVAVVWAHWSTWSVPLEEHLLASEGQWLRPVAGNGWATAVAGDVQVDAARILGWDSGRAGSTVVGTLPVASVVRRDTVDVGLVLHVKSREVLPCKTSGVLWAAANVWCKECPCP